MNDRIGKTFEDVINAAVEQAQDGSEILKELEPELDWVNLRDLIGERICIVRISNASPGMGDAARWVIYCGLDKEAFRFSTEHSVVIEQLDALKPYLPVWVEPARTMGKNKLEYFHLT